MLLICGEEFSAGVGCDACGWIFAIIILCIPVHLILILSVIGLIGVFPTSACPYAVICFSLSSHCVEGLESHADAVTRAVLGV
jgi:hypothetical protein